MTTSIINLQHKKYVFILLSVFTLTPFVSPPIALLMGIIWGTTLGDVYPQLQTSLPKQLLQYSIVGLGFGTNVFAAYEVSKSGISLIIPSIFLTLGLGFLLGKIFKIDKNTSTLIASGTAICGGSAIAAVAPSIKAKDDEISISLATVFILNALALFIFPQIGHLLDLTQYQFGLWSAVAIHDTSSVIGAGQAYGDEALKVATTVKLARALWIIPVSLIMGILAKNKQNKVLIPWFIIGFVVSMLLGTFIPGIESFNQLMVFVSKRILVFTLFLIGTGLTYNKMKKTGPKPFLMGLILWMTISVLSLTYIVHYF